MAGEIHPNLKTLVREAIDELLRSTDGLTAYKFASAQDSPEATLPTAVISVLGFSGEQMKGSLVISCERKLLEKSHPNNAMGMPIGDEDITDWIGELANQMLGRLKNKITIYGCSFSMSTPTTMSSNGLKLTKPKNGSSLEIRYTGDLGELVIHFLAVIDPIFNFDTTQKKMDAKKEGDSILF